MALLWCWCEGPFVFGRYWKIRTSCRRAILPIWPQSLRSYTRTMCELGQSSPLVRYSRQNLWAEAATAHVLLGGPRLNVLRQKWVFYYPIEKLMSSADIDASHFTTACEASIWPHTYSLAHDAFSRSHRKRCSRSHAHRSLCPPTPRTASRVGDFLTPYVKLKKKLNDFQWIKLFHVPPKKANFWGSWDFFRMA